MKLSVLLLTVTTLHIFAEDVYSQNKLFSLSYDMTNVGNILKEIEEQSDFYFLFNQELVDVDKEVSINVTNKKLEEILANLFKGTDVAYAMFGKQIILSPSKYLTGLKLESQELTITGIVADVTGTPLPGVNIMEKGTTNGTISNLDGEYSILVSAPGSIISFSYVGYLTEEIEIGAQTQIDVTLIEDIQSLEEVVVVGYGSVKRSDLTGSVGSVDAEDLTRRGATGVLESMQGAIAGVNISQTSSRPGAGFNIQIRGQNTLNNDAKPPLYVVDGIVTNDIDFLNPADIVKVDILKDASSTAIYGSRGSNGVVMVTTKNAGEVSEGKTVVSYNGFVGIKKPARMPTFFSGRNWFEYRSHAYLQYNPGNGNNGMDDWTMNLTGVYMANPEAARRAYEQEDTDWLGATTQDGMQKNHYVNVAGNSGNMNFNVGMGYQDEDGIWIKENLKRYNMKLSLNYIISDKWQIGATTNLSQTEIESGNPLAYQQILRMAPILKVYDDNGDILIQPGLVANMGGVGNNFTGNTNPLWEIENGSDNTRRQDILASAYLQFSPIDGLDIKTVIQPKFNRNRVGKYTEMSTSLSQRTGYSKNAEAFDYTWDNIISYQKSLQQMHNFKVTAIQSVYSSRMENLEVKTQELPYDSEWYNLFSGNLVNSNSSSGYSEVKMLSYLGRLNYDYSGKYLLTASLRYDGSSKLADKWALFPSFAVGWRISEELPQSDFLSNLKLRFSYGKSGNNNGVNAFATFLGPQYSSTVYYNYGNTVVNGFAPGLPVNTALTWEKTTETNLGVDFGFFNGRINGSIELYNRLSDDLLMQRRLAIESGVPEMNDNIGSVRNKGVELSLNTVNIQTRNLTWRTSFIFAKNNNEIVSLYGRKEDVVGEKRFIGEPINVIYDYKFDGVFTTQNLTNFSNYTPNPGHAKVVDTDNDGAITADDKIILGSPDPKWTGGFTTSLQFKSIDFNLSLIANNGRFIRDQFAANANNWGGRSTQIWADAEEFYYPQNAPRPDWNNPITDGDGNITGIGYVPAAQENVNAKYPAYRGADGPYYSSEAMNYMEVSFVKIKNISLGYTLNEDLLARVGLTKVRLFVNVLDPFVFSDYFGWDPEYATTSSNGGNGPSSITYQFGVNVDF